MADDAPKIGPPPKWMPWVAWGTGAVALFALLLGRPTLDGIDAEYPRRDVVRDNANAGKPLAIEPGEDGEDSQEIRDALSVLPEMLTILADQKNARILITNLAAIRDRGVEPGLPVSHVAGFFSRDDWQLHIAHDASPSGMVALHEYGHFVDAALDDCSESIAFGAIFKAAVDKGELGQHYVSSAAEMFAYMFSQHYFSDRRRARLANDYPEATTFFATLGSTGACPDPLSSTPP